MPRPFCPSDISPVRGITSTSQSPLCKGGGTNDKLVGGLFVIKIIPQSKPTVLPAPFTKEPLVFANLNTKEPSPVLQWFRTVTYIFNKFPTVPVINGINPKTIIQMAIIANINFNHFNF